MFFAKVVIILSEKIIRKNIGFDLSERDQELAYQILATKRGKELSKFVSKAVIMSEYLQRKSQTDYLLKRGDEIIKEADGLLEVHHTKKQKKQNVRKKVTVSETTDSAKTTQKQQNVQITQTTQKDENILPAQQVDVQDQTQTETMEEIAYPVNHGSEAEPVPVYETKSEQTPSVPDAMSDKTDENLEDDIFQQAMSFMSNF